MRNVFSLGAFATLSIFCFAQSPSPRFEVASVKPTPPGIENMSMNGGPMPQGPFNQEFVTKAAHDPGRITWANVRLKRMMQVAYDLPGERISGPDWLDKDGFTTVATLPPGASVEQFRLMLQNLLAERFKLAVHRETRQNSGFVMEVVKGGLKIKPSNIEAQTDAISAADDKRPNSKYDEAVKAMSSRTAAFNSMVTVDQNGFGVPRPGNPAYPPGAGFGVTIEVNGMFRSTVLNTPMSGIAAFLGDLAGAPAEDRTGLPGNYDMYLEFVPRPSDTGAPANAASEPGPDVLDAMQAQLGLKLTARKVPVEVLVVDHAERIPADN